MCELWWRTPTVGLLNQDRSRDPLYASKLRAKGQTVTLAAQVKAVEAGLECPCRCHTSMSSAADSRAKTSASPGREPGSTVPARVFGANTRVSLANFDPGTSSWRTSQLSLLEDSGECLETWPRSGMTRSGTAFQLQPLAPLTGGIASGLWPTPVARDDGKTLEAHLAMKQRMKGGPRKTITSLTVMVKAVERGLWPTPSVKGNYNRKGLSAKSGDGLATAVNNWPTPTKSDGGNGPGRARTTQVGNNLRTAVAESYKTPTAAPFSHGGSGGELHKQVAPSGGPLNPQWVAWLMGFPIDWLNLPATETRSSRRSRSGSARKSSTTKGGQRDS